MHLFVSRRVQDDNIELSIVPSKDCSFNSPAESLPARFQIVGLDIDDRIRRPYKLLKFFQGVVAVAPQRLQTLDGGLPPPTMKHQEV